MTQVLRTACTRDCPDACGILAHVHEGRILRIQGDPEHPITRGFLCERTSRFLSRHYSDARLRTPLIRRAGALEPATWDEALDFIAATLLRIKAESGPASIFHYRSGGSLGILKQAVDFLFGCFGPVTVKRGDICSGAGEFAQITDFGLSDSTDPQDLVHAKAILLWGKNPVVSSPHLIPILKEARKRGAHLALIDPIRHKTDGLCDLILQPRAGGDFALAMAVAQVLFAHDNMDPSAATYCDHLDAYRTLVMSRSVASWAVEADVRECDVYALADLYGAARPAAILVGWGMQRRTDGAAIVRALDALCAVSGNLGVSGGGVSFYFQRRGPFDMQCLQPPAEPPRSIVEPLFGQQVLAAKDPPIRAIWITAGNPVVMLPDSKQTAKAIASRDLVVVVDQFLTDTARLATVVLPTTTFLEEDDVIGSYGHHFMNSVRSVVSPLPGVRSDFEIAQALAPRLGLGDLLSMDARTWKAKVLGTVALDDLDRAPVRRPEAPPIMFEGRRMRTATGRVNLVHEAPCAPSCPSTEEFPLTLMAVSVPQAQCSQWSTGEPDDLLAARVHPSAANGFAHGEQASLRSSLGTLRVRVIHDAALRPGIVVLPKGGSLAKGRCANALTQAVLTDMGEGGALYEERVVLESLSPSGGRAPSP